MTFTTAGWRDEFELARDFRSKGRQSELLAGVRSGELVAVTRGAYRYAAAISTDKQSRADDAYLAKVRAVHLLSREPLVFAAHSAAVVWQLPSLSEWPATVSVASRPGPGGRSNTTVSRSSVGHPAPGVERDGLIVTTLARTVVDVGRTAGFGQGVAMADAALHGEQHRVSRSLRPPIEPKMLWDDLAGFGSLPGVARCRGVLDFADLGSGSPGESLSRVAIHLAGLPAPELQVSFFDRRGFIGTVDFWWPRFQLIGEFDGRGKYLRDEFTRGRGVAQIVMEEKEREDRLRALGNGMARWGWATAGSVPRLRTHLIEAGLRASR